MVSKKIFFYEELNLHFLNSFVELSNGLQAEIKKNWKQQIILGKKYTNGELFSIDEINIESGLINIFTKKTTYDHYLYSAKNKLTGSSACRSIAANILPITNDGYYVLCTMSDHTSLPNKIKFIGGALSDADILLKEISPRKGIERESLEEIGLDLNDIELVANIYPHYLIIRDNLSFLNIFFLVDLNLSSHDLAQIFENHKTTLCKSNCEIELQNLLFLAKDDKTIREFACNQNNVMIDYMEEVFQVLTGDLKVNNLKKEIMNGLGK